MLIKAKLFLTYGSTVIEKTIMQKKCNFSLQAISTFQSQLLTRGKIICLEQKSAKRPAREQL